MTTGIRTFHPRRGRMGPTARATLARLLPEYGLPGTGEPVDLGRLFRRELPVVLEIGCGMGEATIEHAQREPDVGIVAVDVHTPGIAAVLAACEAAALDNVRVVLGDAVTLLHDRIPPDSLAGIRVYFPDPWPKARHAKRRFVRPELVHLAATRLRPGGILHTATDSPDYAAQMLHVLTAEPLLVNCSTGYAPRDPGRPVTRFERRALELGHPVRDVMFRRNGVTAA